METAAKTCLNFLTKRNSMNTVEFKEYRPTPGEKHLGIATILINNLIYLRYKITTGKNGGYFPNPPSYKVTEYGAESYISAFVIESNMLKEQVDACLKTNVNRILANGQHSDSVFSPQPSFPQQTAYAQQMAKPAQQFPHAANTQAQIFSNQSIGGEEIPF